jgi:hypothetical protein
VQLGAIQFADKQTSVIKTPTRTVCLPLVAAPTPLWVNRLPIPSRIAPTEFNRPLLISPAILGIDPMLGS